jgi:hypothetical protein
MEGLLGKSLCTLFMRVQAGSVVKGTLKRRSVHLEKHKEIEQLNLNKTANIHARKAYQKQKQTQEACDAFAKALALEPNLSEARAP